MNRMLLSAAAPAALLAALAIGCRGSDAPRPTRHVLLITLDTTRADRLGCYGYERPTSPNLDRLAAESTVFDLAIAQASVTPVSCASILTGLNPFNHGLRVLHGQEANVLAGERTTLAEVWLAAGGRTAAFVSAYPAGRAFGLAQGFQHFDERFLRAGTVPPVAPDGAVNTGASQRRADETTDAALAWLEGNADAGEPILLWVHYFDPHDPFLPVPSEILERFPPASDTRADFMRAFYDAEVFHMDLHIGRLIEAFRELGLWQDTLVAVVADHGEGLGDHDWWSHGILYQEQIRVPLILRLPEADRGRRIPGLVRTIDLMPTILDAAGVDPARWPPSDGRSLLDEIKDGTTDETRYAYADSVNLVGYGRPDDESAVDHKDDRLYCVMSATHKLIFHQFREEEVEFYDLRADPGELDNLASENPPEMQPLLEHLRSLDALSEIDIAPGVTAADWERMERLRSLGYTQ